MRKKILGAAAGMCLLFAAAVIIPSEPAAAGPPDNVVACQQAAEGSYQSCLELGLKNSVCRQVKAQALAQCMRSR